MPKLPQVSFALWLAIAAVQNYIFAETAMKVVCFVRQKLPLWRIVTTAVECRGDLLGNDLPRLKG